MTARPGPIRTCIGCRTRRPAAELVRVTNLGDELGIDISGSGGRGAWLCRKVDCAAQAGRSRAFSRAFRSKLPDADFADRLVDWFCRS